MQLLLKKSNLDMHKLQAFVECAVYEYALACEQAEYKVMLESGNEAELRAYYEEANDGFLAKIKEFFSNLIERIKEFFRDIVTKITEFITNDRIDDGLIETKMKEIIKDEKIGNKKIEIIDYTKTKKCAVTYINKYSDLVNKLVKKNKNIKNSEVEKISYSYKKEITEIKSNPITITLKDSIQKYKEIRVEAKNGFEADKVKTIDYTNKINNNVKPEVANTLMKISTEIFNICKDVVLIKYSVYRTLVKEYKKVGVTTTDTIKDLQDWR